MNVKVLYVVLLVFMLVFPDADAWGRRRWRIPKCKYRCRYDCSYGSRCRWKCGWSCGRRKRDADAKFEDPENDDQDPAHVNSYHELFSVPLPYKMAIYDANKDGRISFHEFMKVLPKPSDRKAAQSTFKALDKNGDKYIVCKELGQLAPNKKAQC